MGTFTTLGLYKPDPGEPGSTWTDFIEANFDIINGLFVAMYDRIVCDESGVTFLAGDVVIY